MWKFIDSSKANKFKNLMDISKTLWKFIFIVYKSHWNALYIDNNTTLKNKVKSQFSSWVMNNPVSNKDKDIVKSTFVSFIPLPILAFKFFRKIKKLGLKKFYT